MDLLHACLEEEANIEEFQLSHYFYFRCRRVEKVKGIRAQVTSAGHKRRGLLTVLWEEVERESRPACHTVSTVFKLTVYPERSRGPVPLRFFVSSCIESWIFQYGLHVSTYSQLMKLTPSQFYSEAILSRRGPLAKVWLAAHMERKLSKVQTLQTDIEESVGMYFCFICAYTDEHGTFFRCDNGSRGRNHGSAPEWTTSSGRGSYLQPKGKISAR